MKPLEDIRAAMDCHSELGHKINEIAIRKPLYDLLLKETGCKNSEELITEYKKRFGEIEHLKIIILE